MKYGLMIAMVAAAQMALATVTMLDDGYTEEEWVRTGMSPCTGGSSIRRLATSGDYVHIYNDTNGVFRAPSDRSIVIHYLLVGGGGGGGMTCGGGGGGGGVVFGTLTLNAGETIMLYPGQGGLGRGMSTTWYEPWAVYEGYSSSLGWSTGAGENGKATRLVRGGETISAPGGGGGGTFQGGGVAVTGAGTGGNGGTGGRATGGGSQWESGGAASASPNHAGNGADGCGTYIAGEIRYFGGGGGGSCGGDVGTCAGGTGGIGGGGNGRSSSEGYIGDTGVMNTGGGGGGGNHCSYHLGGPGGRGIAIIRYAGAGLTPVVNSCIDRTVADNENVVIGEYTATDGTEGAPSESAPGLGGDEIRVLSNGEYVHKFTQDGTFTAPLGAATIVQYLVVGGGGGGGGGVQTSSYYAAGGGGGGVRFGTLTVPGGHKISIVIGAGGATAAHGVSGGDTTITMDGTTVLAHGGGGGGWYSSSTGYSGGSGGGSQGMPLDFEEGRWGGVGSGETAGGGGGAGRPGKKATVKEGKNCGGAGGDGVFCAITGTMTGYAGGGGSGTRYWGGKGGAGGGANGACYEALEANQVASTPRANSGGGGGGGNAFAQKNSIGSKGADGVVILRYYSTAKPVESGSAFDIALGVDVVDPLAVTRGDSSHSRRGRGGAWTRLSNGDFLHRFDKGRCRFRAPGTNNEDIVSSLRYLVVAGGGSGGSSWTTGGGGGGGVLAGYRPGAAAEMFNIVVGAGGESVTGKRGVTGGDSSLTHASGMEFIAKGGGGGGSWVGSGGLDGGSGGGASYSNYGGKGLTSCCHRGGNTSGNYYGGGGGGACEDGGDAPVNDNRCGDGGDGYNSTITGEAGVYYSGGGGGGAYNAGVSAAGERGLGGGHECRGGGGSGDPYGQNGRPSEAGGDGVVYIRYASAIPTEGPNGIPLGASGIDATDVADFEIPPIPRQIMNKKTQTYNKSTQTFSPGCAPAVGPFYDDYGSLLTEGVDYKVTYLNNNRAGTACAVVEGITSTVVGTNTIPFQISVYNGLIVTFW